jgi:hypothetical protein
MSLTEGINMDIEQIRKITPELAQILREELKGSQAYLFKAFCEHVDALVNWHIANIGALSNRVTQLEQAAKDNLPKAEVN